MSVIIPVYNCERYIAEAVESVLAQSYRDYEIIVVDDGSTDGTRRALEPYMGAIRYIYQENRGEPAARNNGIRNSDCEFIAFLDADDLWLPEKLELQMDYLHRHSDCGLVYTDMKIFDERGIIEESVKVCKNLDLPSGWIFERLFGETLFQTSSVVFRKACVDRVGPFDESLLIGCDYDMWLRIARHFKMGYIDRPLVMYRQHPGMSTRAIGKALDNGMPWEAKVLKKILAIHPEAIDGLGRARVKRRLSLPYFNLAYAYFEAGDYIEARKLLGRAIKYWPTNLRYQAYYLLSFLSAPQVSALRGFYRRLSRSAALGNGRNNG